MRVSRCPNAYAWTPESRKKPYLGGPTQTGKRRNPKYHANRYPDHLRQRRRSPPAAGSVGQRGHRVRPDQRIHRIDTTQPVRHDGDGRHGRSAGEGLRPGPAAVKYAVARSTDIGTSLGRRRGLKAFFAFLSLLAWTPLGNIKTSYRCRRCGEDFSKPAPSPGQTPGDRITGTPPDTNPEAEQ